MSSKIKLNKAKLLKELKASAAKHETAYAKEVADKRKSDIKTAETEIKKLQKELATLKKGGGVTSGGYHRRFDTPVSLKTEYKAAIKQLELCGETEIYADGIIDKRSMLYNDFYGID